MSRATGNARFVVGTLLIAETTTALIATGMRDTAVFVFTVGELLAKADTLYGKGVRVQGAVEGDTVRWDSGSTTLSFVLGDGGERLEVGSRGPKPDMPGYGAEAGVEGEYTPRGIFEAQKIDLKCPSRYDAAATATVTH